jgi:hypothetical protein
MAAESHGLAEWQRFRRREPLTFLRAKIEIVSGPPGLQLELSWRGIVDAEILFRFSWPDGPGVRRFDVRAKVRALEEDDADGLLRFIMSHAAWDIEQDSASPTRLRIRGNRAALEHTQKIGREESSPAATRAPTNQRFAYSCSKCKATMSNETVATYAAMMPCGHSWAWLSSTVPDR